MLSKHLSAFHLPQEFLSIIVKNSWTFLKLVKIIANYILKILILVIVIYFKAFIVWSYLDMAVNIS